METAARLKLDQVYTNSRTQVEAFTYALGRHGSTKYLLVSGEAPPFEGEWRGDTLVCPCNAANAAMLRQMIPALAPRALGVERSIGMGDRIGLATPGHLRAIPGSGFIPVLAQQSPRELSKTGRTPQNVLDSATWGAFQTGWNNGYGADADHVHTTDEADPFIAAGFTMYTLDPAALIDEHADTDDDDVLTEKFVALPWARLETNGPSLIQHYHERVINAGGLALVPGKHDILHAAVKFGRALLFLRDLAAHIRAKRGDLTTDIELAFDTTREATSSFEHYFIATELKRLGVTWTSFVPLIHTMMQKGVDFSGDHAEFERTLRYHAAIARSLGGYKIGLHTISDKFSLYPIIARILGDKVHLKTAGTSWLEAVRVLANLQPEHFRQIMRIARTEYTANREAYRLKTEYADLPPIESLGDKDLPDLLSHDAARQALHVAYGSILSQPKLKKKLLEALGENEEGYFNVLFFHFQQHLEAWHTNHT